MILCVCLNPSFDRTAEVEGFRIGETNRITRARTDLGGKGVNVCRVLDRLRAESKCLLCMGEDGAERFRAMLEAEHIRFSAVTVPGAVRTNLKILSEGALTEVNEPGPELDQEALQSVEALLQQEAAEADWIVLTGSLPKGCPSDLYARMMRMLPEKRFILDASGDALMEGLSAGPALVKPNRDELSKAVGRELKGLQEIRQAALELISRGAGAVIVSMGGEGALLVEKDRCDYAPAIPVRVGSSVGAGDAMVGAMLTGLEKTGNLREAFRYGVAGGTCSVMTEGTGLIEPERFGEMLERVEITEVP